MDDDYEFDEEVVEDNDNIYDEFFEQKDEESENDSDDDDEDDDELENKFQEIKSRKIDKVKITTVEIMTEYEYDALIGNLANLIDHGMPVNPAVFKIKDVDRSLDIAKIWLDNSKTIPFPLKLSRPLLDGNFHIRNVSDLILPHEL